MAKPLNSEKQIAFVQAYVACGGNGSAAARQAGYAEASAAREAWRLLQNPAIVDAIIEETLKAFSRDVPAARQVLNELMLNADSDGVRLQAAKILLEHGGLIIAQRHEFVSKVDERTDEEILARIKALNEELGEALH